MPHLDKAVELITVSVDTPFAQGRFAKEAKIDNVLFLSDFRGGDFGKAYGLLVKDADDVFVEDNRFVSNDVALFFDAGLSADRRVSCATCCVSWNSAMILLVSRNGSHSSLAAT